MTYIFKGIITMGILSSLFGQGESAEKFVTESSFNENIKKQIAMSPQTIAQLRKYGVNDTTNLKLEFFFYTNADDKAQKLAESLIVLGYTVESKRSADNKDIYLITGWTSPIVMSETSVINWTEFMCKNGFKYDCEFDGWGTNPKQ